jgi:hypothetical protein
VGDDEARLDAMRPNWAIGFATMFVTFKNGSRGKRARQWRQILLERVETFRRIVTLKSSIAVPD